MDENRRFVLEFVAVQLVVVAALIHLGLGLFNWQRWLAAGLLIPTDYRWPVFVVSGIAILLGTYVASGREDRRLFYLAGAAVMLGYVLAYFGWHLGGHRLFLVYGPGGATESITLQWFLDHLTAGPIEFASVVVETAAAVVLGILFFSTRE